MHVFQDPHRVNFHLLATDESIRFFLLLNILLELYLGIYLFVTTVASQYAYMHGLLCFRCFCVLLFSYLSRRVNYNEALQQFLLLFIFVNEFEDLP